jgi:hypothetical protein
LSGDQVIGSLLLPGQRLRIDLLPGAAKRWAAE